MPSHSKLNEADECGLNTASLQEELVEVVATNCNPNSCWNFSWSSKSVHLTSKLNLSGSFVWKPHNILCSMPTDLQHSDPKQVESSAMLTWADWWRKCWHWRTVKQTGQGTVLFIYIYIYMFERDVWKLLGMEGPTKGSNKANTLEWHIRTPIEQLKFETLEHRSVPGSFVFKESFSSSTVMAANPSDWQWQVLKRHVFDFGAMVLAWDILQRQWKMV